jgi:hypothetical protein
MVHFQDQRGPNLFFSQESIAGGGAKSELDVTSKTLEELRKEGYSVSVYEITGASGKDTVAFISKKAGIPNDYCVLNYARGSLGFSEKTWSDVENLQFNDSRVTSPRQIDVMGHTVIIASIGGELSEDFKGQIERFTKVEDAVQKLEKELSTNGQFSHSLDLSEPSFGKICLALGANSQLILYGDVREAYLSHLGDSVETGAEADSEDVLLAMSDGQSNLDDVEVFHQDIQPPEGIENYTIVGGGCALIEPSTRTIYVAGCSGKFGYMARDAIRACFRGSGYTVVTDTETIAQGGGGTEKFYFTDKGRVAIGKAIPQT